MNFLIDKELTELRERNKLRAQEKIKELGTKWLLHPSNSPKTKNVKKQTHRKTNKKF